MDSNSYHLYVMSQYTKFFGNILPECEAIENIYPENSSPFDQKNTFSRIFRAWIIVEEQLRETIIDSTNKLTMFSKTNNIIDTKMLMSISQCHMLALTYVCTSKNLIQNLLNSTDEFPCETKQYYRDLSDSTNARKAFMSQVSETIEQYSSYFINSPIKSSRKNTISYLLSENTKTTTRQLYDANAKSRQLSLQLVAAENKITSYKVIVFAVCLVFAIFAGFMFMVLPSSKKLENYHSQNYSASTKSQKSNSIQSSDSTPSYSDAKDIVMVWIPRTGSKYHRKSTCSNMKSPQQVTLDEAKNLGYTRCSKCKPPS